MYWEFGSNGIKQIYGSFTNLCQKSGQVGRLSKKVGSESGVKILLLITVNIQGKNNIKIVLFKML